jgi:hypothetical protein
MVKKILFILIIFLSSCSSSKYKHTDWEYKNNNPYKKGYKYKPNYKDQEYGHRSYKIYEPKHKKKNKIKY